MGTVRRFKIAGNFEAESIDDAFLRLAAHFGALAAAGQEGAYSSDYVVLGAVHSIVIEPCLDTDESLP